MNKTTERIMNKEEIKFYDVESVLNAVKELREDGILWRTGEPLDDEEFFKELFENADLVCISLQYKPFDSKSPYDSGKETAVLSWNPFFKEE